MRFIHHPSHLHPRTGRLKLIVQVLIAGFLWLGGRLTAEELFEMERIRDPKTLNAIIEQDWHLVPGSLETRQKLISINVGELWKGQPYRVPVRMVVPANRRAKGFHLTGGSTPARLKEDARLNPLEQALLKGGVGLVTTVVQEPGTYGQRQLAIEAERRFFETLNPRYKIQYYGPPHSCVLSQQPMLRRNI